MKEFTTVDTYTVTGRGTAHVVINPENTTRTKMTEEYLNKEILLDGTVQVVYGIEMNCIEHHLGGDYISFLVRDPK